MKRVGLADARSNLSSLVNDVAHGRQRVIIESRGRAKAVLVGLDDLARLERGDRSDAPNPMLSWLRDTAALLQGQRPIRGSSLEALREVREGMVHDAPGVSRRQRRPQARRRRTGQ